MELVLNLVDQLISSDLVSIFGASHVEQLLHILTSILLAFINIFTYNVIPVVNSQNINNIDFDTSQFLKDLIKPIEEIRSIYIVSSDDSETDEAESNEMTDEPEPLKDNDKPNHVQYIFFYYCT